MGAIVIGMVICVVAIIFFTLVYKKNELIDDSIFRGKRAEKYIERIDTWLDILIWCEVVLFIGLFLVL